MVQPFLWSFFDNILNVKVFEEILSCKTSHVIFSICLVCNKKHSLINVKLKNDEKYLKTEVSESNCRTKRTRKATSDSENILLVQCSSKARNGQKMALEVTENDLTVTFVSQCKSATHCMRKVCSEDENKNFDESFTINW